MEPSLDTQETLDEVEVRHDRRHPTPKSPLDKLKDFIQTSGSLAGAVALIIGLGAYAFDKLPFAKASDLAVTNKHVDDLVKSISSLEVNQLQSLELQLMDHVQKISDQISQLPANQGSLIFDLRHDQNEAQQRLTNIKNQLDALQRQE